MLGPVVFHGTVQRIIRAVQAIDQLDRGFGGQRKTAFGDTVKNRVEIVSFVPPFPIKGNIG